MNRFLGIHFPEVTFYTIFKGVEFIGPLYLLPACINAQELQLPLGVG